jgi:hypothetical protein
MGITCFAICFFLKKEGKARVWAKKKDKKKALKLHQTRFGENSMLVSFC